MPRIVAEKSLKLWNSLGPLVLAPPVSGLSLN
uniref:Uncharacterized protein n=1 Tax=Arundo donax TaxID=35708 RepID=A0A0A8XZQ7_ARUDO